jgi:polar amino acid transport system substrate-binding protein
MKRLAALLVLLSAAVLAVAGVAGGGHAKAPVKELSFCTDPTFPPMESTTTSGKVVGFDVDMAAAIAKRWKVKSKAIKTSFPGLIPALNAKRCAVIISGIFVTPDRLKVAGAVAYLHSHRVLLVQGGNPKRIRSPNDLKDKNVAVQAGTKYEEYLKELKDQLGFNLQSYPGDTDAVAQLLIGRADVVLTQDTSAAYQQSQHPGDLAVGYLFPEQDSFGIYYRKSDRALSAALRVAVKALKRNGTLVRLAVKYKLPKEDVQ